MHNNEVCFCGSGKKQKKCHPDIAPQSAMANLYDIFHKIEEETKEIANHVPCKKGCSDCCTNHFEVSYIEFLTILDHLRIKAGGDLVEQFRENAKIALTSGQCRCLFVDDTNGLCQIYEVRPIVCRIYGNYTESFCPKLQDDESVQPYLLDSNDMKVDITNGVYYFDTKYGYHPMKSQPLIHYFGKSLDRQDTIDFKEKVYYAKYKSIEEFANRLVERQMPPAQY